MSEDHLIPSVCSNMLITAESHKTCPEQKTSKTKEAI